MIVSSPRTMLSHILSNLGVSSAEMSIRSTEPTFASCTVPTNRVLRTEESVCDLEEFPIIRLTPESDKLVAQAAEDLRKQEYSPQFRLQVFAGEDEVLFILNLPH